VTTRRRRWIKKRVEVTSVQYDALGWAVETFSNLAIDDVEDRLASNRRTYEALDRLHKKLAPNQ
jgi:hypothetical protein